jgi:hypothetical protein
MDIQSLKSTQIYKEMDKDTFKQWFSRLRDKFIYHIDTLYFVVRVNKDWKESEEVKSFKHYLEVKKKKVEKSLDFEILWDTDLVMKFGYSFGFYKYHIGKTDCFDIFIADSIPNKETPAIFVQLRSQFLWLEGCERAFQKSVKAVEEILKRYDIGIEDIQENRIDYAFHTNYIQDLVNFFPEKYLGEMQVSDFKRWHKEGFFFDDYCFCDYLTLGRRKSNNVFFRVYDKTKEVVEMGYKQFFIWIWLFNGLISKFDAYVLEKCFEKSSWFYKERARLMFYLEYGTDELAKKRIQFLLGDKDYPAAKLKIIADKYVPDITIITNIEFQTKRKFYCHLALPIVTKVIGYMKRISNVLMMQKEIINLLTNDVIRFVKYKGKYQNIRRRDRPIASWWERLRMCKIQEYVSIENYEIVRQYQKNLDVERLKKLTINKIATLAVYMNSDDEMNQCFEKDVLDFLSSLNDNDLSSYFEYKNKKSIELKNQLNGLEKNKRESSYSLLDKQTGEIKFL